jgi:hypothetical protein
MSGTVAVTVTDTPTKIADSRDDGYTPTVVIGVADDSLNDDVVYVGGPDVTTATGVPIPERSPIPFTIGPGGLWAVTTPTLASVEVRVYTP